MEPVKKKRKHIIVDSFEELPEEIKKRILKAGINEDEAEKNFDILLSVLHFKSKIDFFTTTGYQNRHSTKRKRHNKGSSLVNSSIVSVNSLQKEAEELLVELKKKNYKTLTQVGKGGFGKVFVARQVDSKDTEDYRVAIKKIPHETTKQKRKNFQEIRFLRYCEGHQNILTLHTASVYKDEMWLICEYLDGGTLSQAVSIHAFTEPQIAFISNQILSALSFLHSNMIAHRDLKSANIMLQTNGNVKLIDFGLCSDMSQGPVTHMVGSPLWMPPEMIKKQPHSLPVDVWSFGICMVECANGSPPNKKSSILAMFTATTVGYNASSLLSKFSTSFKDFISKCLQQQPEQRYTVPKLQKHDFLKIAKDFSVDEVSEVFKKIFIANRISNSV
eukprot:TRINITY_DN1099_c0_g1_i1.p1 TRINITY_DN1099_c0_g1~~TRINITY_DN1099_c0_g1_i1.p1  ORF type:complete len:388 (+),score=55.93 TRINITY_DN1099_c0_g1_i1:40-1203(+)